MKTIKDLKNSLPQIGHIEWLGVRPLRRAEVLSLTDVMVSIESGLEGDHYSKQGGKRMITLIQKEHLDTLSAFMNTVVSPQAPRRNIVVSGINLLALHDRQFRIGADLILEGTGHCHPCSRMEENLGAGGYNAMRGHGGITARVVQSGQIKVGDTVVSPNEEL